MENHNTTISSCMNIFKNGENQTYKERYTEAWLALIHTIIKNNIYSTPINKDYK